MTLNGFERAATVPNVRGAPVGMHGREVALADCSSRAVRVLVRSV
jgi:hypothetical protein